ncbi:MAG: hypothetical protein JXA04_06640 [Gammaproteobacteria bacterium]|nr:hypothetical protein [Gammaproteobacteria bacterium]
MNKELISVRRNIFDDYEIQGFLLDESDDLILLNYVYDFNLDGLMALRKKDISSIETSKTDSFQTELLKIEGIYTKVNFDTKYDISSWKTFIESAIEKHKYFIIEEEDFEVPEFTIGIIEKICEKSIIMKHFTGIGRWLDEPEEIKYEDITSLQIGNNYLNVYERYFKNKGE